MKIFIIVMSFVLLFNWCYILTEANRARYDEIKTLKDHELRLYAENEKRQYEIDVLTEMIKERK